MFNALDKGMIIAELDPLEGLFLQNGQVAVLFRGIKGLIFIGMQSSQLVQHGCLQRCLPLL